MFPVDLAIHPFSFFSLVYNKLKWFLHAYAIKFTYRRNFYFKFKTYTLILSFLPIFKSLFHLFIYIFQRIFAYITLIYPLPEIPFMFKNKYIMPILLMKQRSKK